MKEKDIISFVQKQKNNWLYNLKDNTKFESTIASPTNLYLVKPNLTIFNDEDYKELSKSILEYPKR